MLCFIVLCVVEIMQCGTGGNDTHVEVLHTEALEGVGPELFEQQLVGEIFGKHPVVEGVDVVFFGESLVELVEFAFLQHYLTGLEALQQLVDIVGVALGKVELAGGDIEEGDAVDVFVEVKTAEEVVLLVFQHFIVVRNARSHQLGDVAFYKSLGQLGVFELFADSHTESGTHQLGQIHVDGVVREAGHLHIGGGAVGAFGEGDAEDRGRAYGIVAVGLVEIAHAEKEHGVGMTLFHSVVLPHQGRNFFFFVCGHCLCFLECKSTYFCGTDRTWTANRLEHFFVKRCLIEGWDLISFFEGEFLSPLRSS